LLLAGSAVRPVAAQEAARADTVPQRDIMDLLNQVLHGAPKLGDTLELPPTTIITVLPAFGANPTVGFLFGVSGNALTRFGPAETTNPSSFYATVNFTTKQQFNVMFRSNLFTTGNVWKLEGDWRYNDSNQPTYGLGPAQPGERESPMDYRLIRFYETVYHEATENVLVGLGYHLNYYFDVIDHNAAQGITPYQEYYAGAGPSHTLSSGLSLNVLTDTRDNPINTMKGIYARGSFRISPTWLGSDDNWQSLEAEFRAYPPLGPKGNVLAFWGLAWLTLGRAPYMDLPAIGWDYNNRSGRAYAQGRIRAADLVYGEAEYRMRLSRNGMWGAVAFLNLTSASDVLTGSLQTPNPGGGAGIRIKLNKHSDTNIGVDFAFGSEGSNGIFFGTGEAF
jgi:hypothetical protein